MGNGFIGYRVLSIPMAWLILNLKRDSISQFNYKKAKPSWGTSMKGRLTESKRAKLRATNHSHNGHAVEYAQAVDLVHRLRKTAGNLSHEKQVHHLSIPVGAVSGDFWCTAEHPHSGWFALLADTAGHGLPAAIFSLRAPDIFRAAVAQDRSLEGIYLDLNRFLIDQEINQYFVCGFLVRAHDREIEVLNAGMPDGMLLAADGCQIKRFSSLNLPLGVTRDAIASSERHRLPMGQQASLFLYSDGLSELGQDAGLDIGVDEIVLSAAETPASTIDYVEQFISEHTAKIHDDISLVQICLPLTDRPASESDVVVPAAGNALICFDPILAGSVLDTVNFGVSVTDGRGNIVCVNAAFSRITGYTADEVRGRTSAILRSGRQSGQFYQSLWKSLEQEGGWSGEIWNRRKDGSLYLEWLDIHKLGGGNKVQYVGLMRDITNRRLEEKRIHHSALHDALTGLANRTLLHDRGEQEMRHARRKGSLLGLLFIDLDRFKPINDVLGHGVGDELLKIISLRLSAAFRSNDTLARYGGDEFIALMPDLADRAAAATAAGNALRALREPVDVAGNRLHIGASIGIAMYPDEGKDLDTLLAHADVAMFRAKDAGGNLFRFYSAEMDQLAGDTLQLEARLHAALANEELEVHFQPKVELAGGRMAGVEALVRWRDPLRGLVPPGEFIPIAERSSLITEIGSWVLGEACQALARLRAAGYDVAHVAVNVSPRQFVRHDIVAEVDAALAAANLPHTALQLEVTESLFIKDSDHMATILKQLSAKGVSLALDDFGSGYSSLGYLRDLPFDTLKIDREFIRGVHSNRYNGSIARAALQLADGMDMHVVAEGIEDDEQHRFLAGLGCRYGQGFKFDQALPEEKLLARLKQGNEGGFAYDMLH